MIQEYGSTDLWRVEGVHANAPVAPAGTGACASCDNYISPGMKSILRRHLQEHILTIACWEGAQGMSLYSNDTFTSFIPIERRTVETVIPHEGTPV